MMSILKEMDRGELSTTVATTNQILVATTATLQVKCIDL